MTEKSTKSALEAITTDIKIDLDAVVSIYVAQYETSLHAKKTVLSNEIKRVKKEVKSLDKRLIDSVDQTEYSIKVPILNLKSKVERVTIAWKGDEDEDSYDTRDIKKSTLIVRVEVKDIDSERRYANTLDKDIHKKIAKTDENIHTALLIELKELSGELTEILTLIKSVSRKERQVRGRLSEKKLKASGFKGLLNDSEMLALVQLD